MIEIKLTEKELESILQAYYIKVYENDIFVYVTIEKGGGVCGDYPWQSMYVNRTIVINKQQIKIKERLSDDEILEVLENTFNLSNCKADSIKPKFNVIKGYGVSDDIVNIDFYEIRFRKKQKVLRK